MTESTVLRTEPRSTDQYQVRAVRRALDVLDCFTPSEPELTLGQLAEETGLSMSTAYRLVQTLECHDYVEQNPRTGRYRLGISCLRLGGNVMARLDIRDNLRPLLTTLRDEYGETIHLAVLDQSCMEVIYLDKRDGLHGIGMISRVGARAPAHCTGVGKCLLAHVDPAVVATFHAEQPLQCFTPNTITDPEKLLESLADIRERGYALDCVEHEPDVKCVAVPVYDYTGTVACSASVSGPEARMDLHIEQEDLVERMLKLASDASDRLGYSGTVNQAALRR